MKHRNIGFKIEVLGLDTWRWTILPPNAMGPNPCWTGASTHEQAIAHCKAEIDAMLARESMDASVLSFLPSHLT